ncbi:MAG: hypothetical protein ACHQIM_01390 [Sphingobacteriales bacterium]
MLHYFTLNTIVETICFVIAFLCLKKDASLVWRSMVLFLFVTCVIEMSGIYFKRLYLADRVHAHPNIWLYNILLLFQAGMFNWMFRQLLSKYIKSRPIIISGLAILAILYACEIFAHGIFIYNELTNTVMSVMLVMYSFYFYYCLIKDEAYIRLRNSPEFWWVAGVLFFYFGTTACNLFYNIVASLVINTKQSFNYYKYLYYAFNILLYGCWSYSFICKKWLTTTSKV